MSEKYKVHIAQFKKGAAPAMHTKVGTSGQQMNKVTDTVLDITKVAVTGSVAMGLLGATGTLMKK